MRKPFDSRSAQVTRGPLAQGKPTVVLYNWRAVFYTMPLAMSWRVSLLDRFEVDVQIIDGRLEADSGARGR